MEKYLNVFVVLGIISYIYLKLAVKFKIIDKPNERSSHTKPTIRGGGIVFPIAILLFFLLNDFQYPYFCLSIVLIAVVSFLDDIYTLSSKTRLPFQLLCVCLILFEIGYPFTPIWAFLFFLIFSAGIVNMFNFMDGINGITGIYSLSVLFGYFIINTNESLINTDLIIYTALSIVVFGFYNFRKKALFFAGDIGSIVLGMLIFFIGFLFTYKLESPLMLMIIVVYGADAGCTFLYRKFYTKESIFDAHRHHIYQKLVDSGGVSHIKVSISYTIIQIAINFIIFKSYKLDLITQVIIFFSMMLFFVFCYIILFKKLKNKEFLKDEV